ncbi:MAG: hypothetical protein K2Y14_04275 [Burkholderiales bacterium]|nr:hypothetical protein [Burkholderiales bacterium]
MIKTMRKLIYLLPMLVLLASCNNNSDQVKQLEHEKQLLVSQSQQNLALKDQQIKALEVKNFELMKLVDGKYMLQFDFSPMSYTKLANNLTQNSFLPNWLESNLRVSLATKLQQNVFAQADFKLSVRQLALLFISYHSAPILLMIMLLAGLIWASYYSGFRFIRLIISRRIKQLRRTKLILKLSEELLSKCLIEKHALQSEIDELLLKKEQLGRLMDLDVLEEKRKTLVECEEMLTHAKNQGYSMIKQAQRDARQIREQAEDEVKALQAARNDALN